MVSPPHRTFTASVHLNGSRPGEAMGIPRRPNSSKVTCQPEPWLHSYNCIWLWPWSQPFLSFPFETRQQYWHQIFSQHDQEILFLHLKYQFISAPELEFSPGVSNYWYLIESHFPFPGFLLVVPVSVFNWNALLKKTQVITTRRWGGEVVLRKNTTPIGQWSCLWLPTECQATHKSQTYFGDKVNSPFHKKHTALRQILIFHTLYYQLDKKKKTQQQCFIPTVWGQLI